MARDIAFLSDANKRIVAHSALILGTAKTSTFYGIYVKLPTAANDGPVVCVTTRNFFEPPMTYMGYAIGDDPTAVTGVAWASPYDSSGIGQPIAAAVSGELELCIAAGTIAAGDLLVIADIYGRVTNLAGAGIGAGSHVYPVGIAQGPGVANGFVEVLLSFMPFVW